MFPTLMLKLLRTVVAVLRVYYCFLSFCIVSHVVNFDILPPFCFVVVPDFGDGTSYYTFLQSIMNSCWDAYLLTMEMSQLMGINNVTSLYNSFTSYELNRRASVLSRENSDLLLHVKATELTEEVHNNQVTMLKP